MRLAVALALVAAAAQAHGLAHPRRAALLLSPAAIELRIELQVAPGVPAQMLRAAFDRNHDGRLDEAEQDLLREHLVRTALLGAELRVDDAVVPLGPPEVRDERLDDRVESTSLLAVRVTLHATWPPKKSFWFLRRTVALALPDAAVSASCQHCTLSSDSAQQRSDELIDAADAPIVFKVRL